MSIKFHLPDFATHYKFNRIFLAMMQHCPEYFHENLEIASIYGTFPQSLWNGGRFIQGYCDKSYVQQVVQAFDKLQIPLRFTFTNPTITEADLKDEFCNFVLKTADNGINGVIVVSPLLEEYIRDKFPGYKVTSSTCKRITDLESLNNEIAKKYDIVVLDYDFNNKFDLLEKVQNKEKCEILVNACCQPNCPNRVQHYHDIGNVQKALCKHIKTARNTPFDMKKYNVTDEHSQSCPYMYYDAADVRQHSTYISPEAIFEKYIPMGFNQFKIEGRTLGIVNLVEHYLHYMVKPEFRDKARLTFYCQLENQKIIVEQPQ